MTVRGDTEDTGAADPEEHRVGDYHLLGIIGEGGMGVVHLAERPDGRRVAMKVLRPHVVGDAEGRDRLAREVGSLRRVSSPRVAEVLDADPYGPVPYVVTRYVAGPPLHEQVRRHGALGEDDLRVFALGLAEALADVHRAGVLHRDVKPANVLLEDGAPVLIDFGLARVADDPRLTATGWLLGTPGYLAPEVIEGREVGPAADVHAWAATVVFAGTGRPPAGTGPAMAIMDRVRRGEHDLDGVPRSLEPLLDACLAPEPGDRPRLDQVVGALTPADDPPAGAEPTTRIVPAFLDPVPAAAPTRMLPGESLEPAPRPRDEARPGDQWDEDAWEPDEQLLPGRPPRRGRLGVGLLGLGVLGGAAVALAPYAGAAVLAAVAAVLRFCSVTAQRHRRRQALRGRSRWYDVPASTVSLPAYLLRSLVGTALLLVVAVALVAVAALVEAAAGVPLVPGLLIAGVVFVLALWWGPGSGRLRRTTRWLAAPLGEDTAAGPSTALVALGFAGILVLVLAVQGPLWAPTGGPPWDTGFLADIADRIR